MDIWDFLSNDQAKWAPRRSRPHVRWSLPSGKNPFKSHRFWAPRRPGVAPLRDPVPKILHFFGRFFGPACLRPRYVKSLRSGFFGNVKKVRSKGHIGYAAWGLPQGPAFACTLTMSNKTKNQKLEKTQVLFRIVYKKNILCFHSVRRNVYLV